MTIRPEERIPPWSHCVFLAQVADDPNGDLSQLRDTETRRSACVERPRGCRHDVLKRKLRSPRFAIVTQSQWAVTVKPLDLI